MTHPQCTDACPQLAIVVPCYNEEAVLPSTASTLVGLLDEMAARGVVRPDSHVYFVDDGSSDATWTLIESLCTSQSRVRGIKLARNAGHQNALLAGLFTAQGDAVVSIDADLQDDVGAIETMVAHYRKGSAIVYGVREQRAADTAFKRGTAEGFYKLMHLMGAKVVYNHADFRLMSRLAIECLKDYGEANLFLRGIVPLIGLTTSEVRYGRKERLLGETKYPLSKMLAFAWEGITSFTITPLRAISLGGILLAFLAVAVLGWVLWIRLVTGTAVPGWASVLAPLLVLSAVQLLALGVVGEYIGKVYKETKRRPRFLIERTLE